MRAASALLLSITAVAIAAPAGAAEFEFPARKPGQWTIEMETPGAPPMVMQACLDAATDRQMMAAGMSMSEGMCSRMDIAEQGGAIVIDATCSMGAMQTTSHSVMSGDFQSAYTVEITSDITGGPPGMPAHSVIVQKATWVGECSGGLAPGDMLMPGGMKVNVQQMMEAMGGG